MKLFKITPKMYGEKFIIKFDSTFPLVKYQVGYVSSSNISYYRYQMLIYINDEMMMFDFSKEILEVLHTHVDDLNNGYLKIIVDTKIICGNPYLSNHYSIIKENGEEIEIPRKVK
jgi:hypothetical protein|tara:strand:- start:116 stop:460 length:345 start_codon:yes stop_codon:yes gene_type:complete